MMTYTKYIVLLSLLLSFFSCTDKKFTKDVWFDKDGYYYRSAIVKDVMDNYLYVAMPYQDVVDLLGQGEQRIDSTKTQLTYQIDVKIEGVFTGIDPEEITYLDVNFDKDSLLVNSELRVVKCK